MSSLMNSAFFPAPLTQVSKQSADIEEVLLDTQATWTKERAELKWAK